MRQCIFSAFFREEFIRTVVQYIEIHTSGDFPIKRQLNRCILNSWIFLRAIE